MLNWRHARRHRARTALVVASIALGVAAWTTTNALDRCLEIALRASATPLTGAADLLVSNGAVGLRRDLADRLARIPGVRAVRPVLVRRILLPVLGHQPAILMGIDLAAQRGEAEASGLEVSHGASAAYVRALILGQRPALLGRALDQALPGGTSHLDVLFDGKLHCLTRVGTIQAHGPAAALGGHVVIMDLQAAAALSGRPDLVSRLDVLLGPGADRDRVRRRFESLLAGRGQVLTPEAHDQRVQEALSGLRAGFSWCGTGALGLGWFLAWNALTVSVAERRREIGILRALGADRGQVGRLLLGEAAWLGAIGAAAGLPLGWGLARLGLGPLQRIVSDVFLPLHAHRLELDSRTALGGMAAGIATTVLAALVPAVRASALTPVEAMTARSSAASGAGAGLRLPSGMAILLLSLGLACFALGGLLPPALRTYGALIAALLGAVLAIPLGSALVARLLRPFVQCWLGIPGRLAADRLIQTPGRGGLAIAALAGGVALMLQTAGVIHGNEEAIRGWVDRCIAGDLFVTSGGPLSASGQTLPMQEDIGPKIEAESPGARAVPMRFRYLDWRRGGRATRILLLALDARRYATANQDRRPPLPDLDLYRRLAEPGTALVSENFAALYGVEAGDTIALPGSNGPIALRVLGTVVDFSCNRGTVMVDRAQYRSQFHADGVDVFSIVLPRPEEAALLGRHLSQTPWAAERALCAMTRQALRRHILGMIRRLYGVASIQEVVAAVVAALGVATALLISILHRRRALGLLRALGATPAQVLTTILIEAALMASIGALFGLMIGMPLEWYVLRVVLLEETGFVFPVRFPWIDAAGLAGLALLSGLLAGLGPAVGAARMPVSEAIAEE